MRVEKAPIEHLFGNSASVSPRTKQKPQPPKKKRLADQGSSDGD